MYVDLDTLATALYCRIDDELKASPQLNPHRPKVGIVPWITDAELITVAVMQALQGYHNESRWIRGAPAQRSCTCSRTCPSSPATTNACGS